MGTKKLLVKLGNSEPLSRKVKGPGIFILRKRSLWETGLCLQMSKGTRFGLYDARGNTRDSRQMFSGEKKMLVQLKKSVETPRAAQRYSGDLRVNEPKMELVQ